MSVVNVYFETSSHAELVAVMEESLYEDPRVWKLLETIAEEQRYFLTDSVQDVKIKPQEENT